MYKKEEVIIFKNMLIVNGSEKKIWETVAALVLSLIDCTEPDLNVKR